MFFESCHRDKVINMTLNVKKQMCFTKISPCDVCKIGLLTVLTWTVSSPVLSGDVSTDWPPINKRLVCTQPRISVGGDESEAAAGREARGRARTSFRHLLSPEFTVCHVKLQTCQRQDFLPFYFQGQMARRGDPTAGGSFPQLCHTSHRKINK